jgi:drug/metabolite transporter (DMT)-like permease
MRNFAVTMWIIFAFISAGLLGLYDAMKKRSLRGNAVIPILFLNTLFCTLFFVPVIVMSATGSLDADSAMFVPACGWHTHKYILLKACIVLSSWVFGYFAMKHLPLTIVGPINATRPVMTVVGAMLIYGEQLNAWQMAGVTLAIVSFYLLSRTGKREGIHFTHNKWIYFLVAAAVLGAMSGLYDKYLMSPNGLHLNKMAVQAWSNAYQCLMMLAMMLIIWHPTRKKTTRFEWRWSILFISVFVTLADLAYFYALTFPDAMISVVSMVRRGSVIVSFACGAIMFGEKNLRAKVLDLALVLAGMICLWIGSH